MQSKINAFIAQDAHIERHSNAAYLRFLKKITAEKPAPVQEPVAAPQPVATFVPEHKHTPPREDEFYATGPAEPEPVASTWTEKVGTVPLIATTALVSAAGGVITGVGIRDALDDKPLFTINHADAVREAGAGETGWHKDLTKKTPLERGQSNSQSGGRD